MFKLFVNGIQIGNYESVNDIIKWVCDYTQTYASTTRRLDASSAKWEGKSYHISTMDRYL